MTAQSFMPPVTLAGAPPKANLAHAEPVAVLESAQAPDRSFMARLWNAYCARRNERRMRNLAQDMDTHLLNDVGAPQWLVNEVALSRDLARLRNNHYLRW
ncbi:MULTISPECIES: hypothetical protein [Achromobacter]|uniref:hypothetical protein n=1 Tax=Achromobacter TaxID=222 RepID=UPI000A8E9DD9|nr:hypothetical protein [Achromobacter mucicolens]MDH1525684.1 hypothetical protein [Achromobacter mucicolens]